MKSLATAAVILLGFLAIVPDADACFRRRCGRCCPSDCEAKAGECPSGYTYAYCVDGLWQAAGTQCPSGAMCYCVLTSWINTHSCSTYPATPTSGCASCASDSACCNGCAAPRRVGLFGRCR
jgi:hypothetical protein